jgi:hypothetical protein
MRMEKARMDGLYLLLLGSAVFLFLGMALECTVDNSMADFKALYYSARCLIQHSDPYNEGELLRVFQAEGGKFPQNPAISQSYRRSVTAAVNTPVTLFLIAPIALLAWGPAHLLWLASIAGGFIVAASLMWCVGARYAPRISGGLIVLLLANSVLLLITGNSAGIAVSLCLVAVWCFLQERFVFAGVLFLAVSLAMKPHDAGLVWLYFLLAGGVHRKRALQTLVVVAVLSLPAVMWISHVAPHWMPELESNLAVSSAHGGLNDPGPASTGGHGIGLVINLQAVLSFFRDDPRFYNPATYLVCGVLLLVWLIATLRSRFTPTGAWFALAAIAPLSLLSVYHRSYDAKLLLLTVPACAMLWAEGGPVAWIALLINASGFALTGDLTWAIILGIINHLSLSTTQLRAQMLLAVQVFPAPLILLAMAIFYLWVYMRRAQGAASRKKGENAGVSTA